MITGKKILVTGGVGFLGTNLCKRLLSQDNEILAVDNLYTGLPENVALLSEHTNFKFINHDITKEMEFEDRSETLRQAQGERVENSTLPTQLNKTGNCITDQQRGDLAEGKENQSPLALSLSKGLRAGQLTTDLRTTNKFMPPFDYIVNLACPASPPHYQKDPIFTTKTSVLGALNMLELARQWNATILQASTSEVYGDPSESPQSEEYRGNVNPIGIRACYDEGKRCAESLFFDYQRMHDVKIKVIRIFNTYGPYMDPNDGRVVSNFIIQALQGKALTLYGTGKQTRSFCFVEDLVDGIVRMLASNNTITGPVNLGNPIEFTMLELTQALADVLGRTLAIDYHPLPADDPQQRCPNITKARELLGWEPKIQLREGLAKTIPYFEAMLASKGMNNTTQQEASL